jgi:hypothetical protein
MDAQQMGGFVFGTVTWGAKAKFRFSLLLIISLELRN